jgi:hypothetical protein
MAVAGLLFGGLIISLLPERWWPALASIVALVSYATWIALGTGRLAGAPPSGTESGSSLLFAAPIIAFGFLLCPWLDRTFHRARQRTPSVHAFGVFGATFFVIILMTVAYGATGELDLTAPILAHLGTQALFTVAVHLREIRIAPFPASRRARQATIVVPALGGLLAAYASGLVRLPFDAAYLLFLGFYGLVFPAYVLLFMPFRRGEAMGLRPWPQTPRALGLYALLIAALSPLCAIGFVGLRTWLLPIAVAAIVAAGLLGRGWFRESAGNSAN